MCKNTKKLPHLTQKACKFMINLLFLQNKKTAI